MRKSGFYFLGAGLLLAVAFVVGNFVVPSWSMIAVPVVMIAFALGILG